MAGKWRWIQQGLVGALGIIAGVGLYNGATYVIAQDPFSKFRGNAKEDSPKQIGATMKDVHLRQYVGPNLVAEAKINTVNITRDRQTAILEGITNGHYRSKDKGEVQFTATEGRWNQVGRMFQVEKAVRLFNKDFDLKSEILVFDERRGLVTATKAISGKFFKGEVKAANLKYHLPTGSYELKAVSWTGALDLQDAPKSKGRWSIKAATVANPTGKRELWSDAEATDGDIIVKALRIERDVKTDVIVATGNVQYFSRETNVQCEKATVFRREKRAIIEGNVSMMVKAKQDDKLEVVPLKPLRPIVPDSIAIDRPPAPTDQDKELDKQVRDPETRRKFPTHVLCQRIEYWYRKGERRAKLIGSPQARQDLDGGRWRQAWAYEGFYDGEKETLKLMSRDGQKEARFKTSIGDDLRADWFLVSTKEGDEAWQGARVEGDVISEDEDLNDRDTGAKPPR